MTSIKNDTRTVITTHSLPELETGLSARSPDTYYGEHTHELNSERERGRYETRRERRNSRRSSRAWYASPVRSSSSSSQKPGRKAVLKLGTLVQKLFDVRDDYGNSGNFVQNRFGSPHQYERPIEHYEMPYSSPVSEYRCEDRTRSSTPQSTNTHSCYGYDQFGIQCDCPDCQSRISGRPPRYGVY